LKPAQDVVLGRKLLVQIQVPIVCVFVDLRSPSLVLQLLLDYGVRDLEPTCITNLPLALSGRDSPACHAQLISYKNFI
jgi:hypothetical protein